MGSGLMRTCLMSTACRIWRRRRARSMTLRYWVRRSIPQVISDIIYEAFWECRADESETARPSRGDPGLVMGLAGSESAARGYRVVIVCIQVKGLTIFVMCARYQAQTYIAKAKMKCLGRSALLSWATIVDCGDVPLTWLDNNVALKQLDKAHRVRIIPPYPNPTT